MGNSAKHMRGPNALGGGQHAAQCDAALQPIGDQRCRYFRKIPHPTAARDEHSASCASSCARLERAAGRCVGDLGWGAAGEGQIYGELIEAARRLGFWMQHGHQWNPGAQRLDIVKMLDHLVIPLAGRRGSNDGPIRQAAHSICNGCLEAARGWSNVWTLSVFTRQQPEVPVDY